MTERLPLNAATLARLATAGVEVPRYARGAQAIRQRICHLGPGRFHRAHQAQFLHRLLQDGDAQGWGLCAISLRAADRAAVNELAAQDGLYSLWQVDGIERQVQVVGSIMEVLDASADALGALERLADAATRIISLTVTEAGYCLRPDGRLDDTHADIVHDLARADAPRSAPGLIVRALALRRARGNGACTLLSCDNLLANGHQLRRAVLGFADSIDPALARWIDAQVSFPCSMVDRITPLPDAAALQAAQAAWPVRDAAPLLCEPWLQWVIEDHFVAGRPPFERAGAVFTYEVEAYERIKVGLLNGGHSALSHAALMLGYSQVHDALADARLRRWLSAYMGDVMPTLPRVAGLPLDDYRDALLQRFANPAIGDRLLRLAQDSSTKFQQTLRAPLAHCLEQGLPCARLSAALALWIVYLDGLSRDARARAHYDDVSKDALIAQAVDAVARGDASEFISARFALAAGVAQLLVAQLNAQLRDLQAQGVAVFLDALDVQG